MENKNKGKIITIIILVIMVVGLGGYLVYDKLNNAEKVVEVENIKSDSIKKDESKELVYDANYKSDSVKEHYTIKTDVNDVVDYYLSDIKVPYINIDSDEVEKVNKEIKKIYLDLEKEYADIVKDATGNQSVEATYDYVIENNVLSIVIKTLVAGTGFMPYDYYTYNIDLATKKTVNYEDLIDRLSKKYNGSKDEDYLSLINNAVDAYYTAHDYQFTHEYQLEDYSIEKSILDTKNNIKSEFEDKTIRFYYDRNENINVIAKIIIPVDIGYDYQPLTITKSQIK